MINKKLTWFLNSGGFTPVSLSPVLYLQNGSSYMNAAGSPWTDIIAGNNFTEATNVPTYTAGAQNGLPSYTFDGVNDKLSGTKLASIENISGLTIWMVSKRGLIEQDDNSITNRIGLIHYSDNNIYCVPNGSVNYASFSFGNFFNYSVMVFDGTQTGNANRLKLWVSGVQRTLSFVGTIGTTTGSSTTDIRVGKYTASSFLAGQVCETGIVARAITSTEVTSLNSYLATKYAL